MISQAQHRHRPDARRSGAQCLAREPSPGGPRPVGRTRSMTACRREAAACWVSSPILTTRRSAPGARSPAAPDRAPRSWWYRPPAARRGRSATPPPGTRRAIAAVREAELRLACERLGVTRVRCLDHVDGTLANADFPALAGEVTGIIREFRPDAVITFGPDGGYGHPDHVTISAATTAACRRAARPPRLYYSCFPPGDLLIMDRLAAWLTSQPGRFTGTPAFAHAPAAGRGGPHPGPSATTSRSAGTRRVPTSSSRARWPPSCS
jgi:hypothetical protein